MRTQLARLANWLTRASLEDPRYSLSDPRLLNALWGDSRNTDAGQNINERNALHISAVWACVNLIANSLAYLPWEVFKEGEEDVPELDPTNYLFKLLRYRPNEWMDDFTFKKMAASHCLLWGNHYSYIKIDGAGRPKGLYPLHPGSVSAKKTKLTEPVVYEATLLDGTIERIPADLMFHVRGTSLDGITGISPIACARNTLGLARAAEVFGSRFFANDARPSLFVEYPGRLPDDAQERLKQSIIEAYQGPNKHFGVMVGEEGLKVHTIQIPPEDAQFLQTRSFQVDEICSFFNVPPHLIARTEKATSWGTGIEQLTRGFLQFCLTPWLKAFEAEADFKLFNPEEKRHSQFNTRLLMRADFLQRMQGYKLGLEAKIFTPNEVRKEEGLPPMDGGDELVQPPAPLGRPNETGKPPKEEEEGGRNVVLRLPHLRSAPPPEPEPPAPPEPPKVKRGRIFRRADGTVDFEIYEPVTENEGV